MEIQEKLGILKNIDLLNFYDEETLRNLMEHCREVSLAPDDTLFDEGSPENAMYLILSGELIVSKGNKQIASLGPSQYLGEMSLIEAKPRSASARATKETILLEINEGQFNKYLASEPQALLAMMRTLSGRIRADLGNTVREMRNLSIFTHDIRNNMTPLGLAEMELMDLIEKLRGTQSDHKAREGLGEVEECFKVITAVKESIMTLLDASLNQFKKIKIAYVKEKCHLVPLIQETLRGVSCHKNLLGKTVKLESAGDIPQSRINAIDITRVLQNLLINAGFVTQDGGEIRVQVQNHHNNIQVSVKDFGAGIPEEIRPYLFKESITTKKDGNGLGLLSCKMIVEENHQGRFWYESEVGKGTTFYFTLPLN